MIWMRIHQSLCSSTCQRGRAYHTATCVRQILYQEMNRKKCIFHVSFIEWSVGGKSSAFEHKIINKLLIVLMKWSHLTYRWDIGFWSHCNGFRIVYVMCVCVLYVPIARAYPILSGFFFSISFDPFSLSFAYDNRSLVEHRIIATWVKITRLKERQPQQQRRGWKSIHSRNEIEAHRHDSFIHSFIVMCMPCFQTKHRHTKLFVLHPIQTVCSLSIEQYSTQIYWIWWHQPSNANKWPIFYCRRMKSARKNVQRILSQSTFIQIQLET